MTSKKTSAKVKMPARIAAPAPATRRTPTSAPRSKPRISAKSAEKAQSAFSKFSLSKFATSEAPPTYVTAKRSLVDVQKGVVSKAIDTLENSPTNRAMTLALPSADIGKLLPSFNAKTGRVQLDDVLTLIQQRMGGREFYANGNPTLNRLSLEASVQQIFDNFKKEVSK
jgi:hypothetical protein